MLSLKKYYIIFCTALISLSLSAQEDPEAKKILDRVSEKTKSYSTIEVEFELVIENKIEDYTSKSEGKVKIKKEKYYIESMGSKVYYNGKDMWSYLIEENEAVVTSPDPEDDDFMENPALIFSFYNRDFKLRLVGEAKLDNRAMHEIDLYPKDLNQPYSRFKLFIDKAKEELYLVTAVGKEGVSYSAYMKNPVYNKNMEDSIFEFDPSKYDDIEVTDMRL